MYCMLCAYRKIMFHTMRQDLSLVSRNWYHTKIYTLFTKPPVQQFIKLIYCSLFTCPIILHGIIAL